MDINDNKDISPPENDNSPENENNAAPEESDIYEQPQRSAAQEPSAPFYAQTPPQNNFRREPWDPIIRKEERRRGKRGLVIAAVSFLALILLATAVVFFFQNFKVDFDFDGQRIYFSFSPKSADILVPPLEPGTEGKDGSSSVPITSAPTGDGTTLIITEKGGTPSRGKPSEDTLTLQEIYKKAIPSVVGIKAEGSSGASTGTGIIMAENGYIITNYHVIKGGSKIIISLENDEEHTASLVGGDEMSDLAVLKIDKTGLIPAEFGNSDNLEVGDEVVAIGNPLGFDLKGTMTNGIISAINRDMIVEGKTMTLLQTNAALNAGNSGGPLINMYGQVIGVNIMKMSSYYSVVEGLGFAIPISSAKPIIDQLISKGYISGRPAIGIQASDIPEEAASYYQIPQGILVESVDERSDAYAKGLKKGDIITAIDGTSVKNSNELNKIKNNYSAGDRVTLKIYRDGNTFNVTIILADASELSS